MSVLEETKHFAKVFVIELGIIFSIFTCFMTYKMIEINGGYANYKWVMMTTVIVQFFPTCHWLIMHKSIWLSQWYTNIQTILVGIGVIELGVLGNPT